MVCNGILLFKFSILKKCNDVMGCKVSTYIGALNGIMFSCGPQGWALGGKSCKIMEKKFMVIFLEGELFFTCQNF